MDLDDLHDARVRPTVQADPWSPAHPVTARPRRRLCSVVRPLAGGEPKELVALIVDDPDAPGAEDALGPLDLYKRSPHGPRPGYVRGGGSRSRANPGSNRRGAVRAEKSWGTFRPLPGAGPVGDRKGARWGSPLKFYHFSSSYGGSPPHLRRLDPLRNTLPRPRNTKRELENAGPMGSWPPSPGTASVVRHLQVGVCPDSSRSHRGPRKPPLRRGVGVSRPQRHGPGPALRAGSPELVRA